MKRGLIFLILFLLIINLVSAIEVDYTSIQSEALPGDPVKYVLHVKNNEPSTLEVSVKSPDLNWLINKEFQNVTITPGQTQDFPVSFSPLSKEKIPAGRYGVKILVITPLTTLEKILPATVANYNDVLESDFISDIKIDPRKGAILRLNITNKRKIVLNDLDLVLNSEHFEFTRKVSLAKGENIVLTLPVDIDSKTIRGNYKANLKVSIKENSLIEKQLDYTIQEYQDLKEISVPNDQFLIAGERITKTNDGNTPVTEYVLRRFSWLSYKFSKFTPEPTRTEKVNSKYLVQWDIVLDPLESKSVAYTVNYRVPIAILILIIIGLLIWYYIRLRNAILVSKRVLTMSNVEGGVKIIKVVITLKNRSAISVNNLRVLDLVPSEIKAPTQHGELRPNSVKSTHQGTLLAWDILSLKGNQERTISYRLEGKMHSLGRIMLPPAKAKYTLFGRAITAKSSFVSLREKKNL